MKHSTSSRAFVLLVSCFIIGSSAQAGEMETEHVTEDPIVGEPVDPNDREVDTGPEASEPRISVPEPAARPERELPPDVKEPPVERPTPRAETPRPEIFDQVHKQYNKQQNDGNVGQ